MQLSAGLCPAATHSWTGAVSQDWYVAGNWTPTGIPGSTDTVYLTNNGSVDLSGAVTIGGVFNWSGGTLSGHGMMIESGGVVNMASNNNYLYIQLTNAGTVNLSGNVLLDLANDDTTLLGGIYNLAGALWDIQTNASIDSQGYGDEFFNNAGKVLRSAGLGTATIEVPFTNSGTVTNLSGALSFNYGGTLAGTFDAASGAIIDFANGNFTVGALPSLSGSGVCEFTGSTLTLNSNVPSGLVLASGTLVLGPGFQNHGAITNLTVGGMTLSSNNTVTGHLTINGVTLTGPLTIESGGMLNIASNGNYLYNILTNAGTVLMTGTGYLDLANDDGTLLGGIYNLAGALWDIQTNANIYSEGYGDEFFNNAGELRKSAGTGTASIDVPFTDSGTVTNLIGTLSFFGGGPLAGTFDVASGAIIDFANGNFTIGVLPSITGPGLCEFTGGTLTLKSNAPPDLDLVSGNLVLGPSFQNDGAITNLTVGGMTLSSNNTVTGMLTLGGATLSGPLTIESGGVLNIASNAVYLYNMLTNAGTVLMTGTGYLDLANDDANLLGGIYNLAGALWDFQTNANIYSEGYGHEFFNNAGTLRKSGGTGTASIQAPFTNSGAISNLIGVLSFYGGGLLAGDFDTAAGATSDFGGGSFTINALPAISGPGLCEFTGTTLTLNSNVPSGLVLAGGNLVLGPGFQNHGAITNLTVGAMTMVSNNTVTGMLTLGGTTLSGPLTIESGGMLNIVSNGNYLYNMLTNAGTVLMTGTGYLDLANDDGTLLGGIYNLTGALWDIQTNANIYSEGYGHEFFNNAGELRKSGGTGVASIEVPFTNSGTVNALTGTLGFTVFTSSSGTLGFGVSSLANYGKINMAGSVSLNGTASLTWLDGFAPAVGNSFSVLDYASQTGAFASITLPSGYAGQGNYGSTVFSITITTTGTPTNSPILNIERGSAGTVVLLWPTVGDFGLQTRTNLASGTWSNITSGVVTVGTNYVFTNTENGKAAFFRLEAP
jgi:hypothetical protein